MRDGAIMQSTTDTEVILHLVARSRATASSTASSTALRQLEGAYSFVALTNKKLIGARDPLGIRPLVLGELDGHPILASETCALDIIGARYVRDVENGEVVVFDENGVQSHKPFPPMPAAALHLRIHLFRAAGFDRRRPRGLRRAQDHGRAARARSAASRPTSSCRCRIPACRPRSAIAQESGIPYELGIIRNHYVGRTFIEPTQQIRELGVRLKHSANRAVVDGKRIVLVDDFDRARHHLGQDRADDARGRRDARCISASPRRRSRIRTITASTRRSATSCSPRRTRIEDMRQFIGADSLAFLSVDGIYRAMGDERRDPVRPQFTDHCFTGDYPTPLTDRDRARSLAAAALAAGRGELTPDIA